MAFRKVTSLDELWSGEMAGHLVDGQKVLLINIDDQVYAYEDRCVHQAVALSEGRLSGQVLVCRAHDWAYDACSGRGVNPVDTQLRAYAVKIQDRDILVDVQRIRAERRGAPSGLVSR